MARTFGRVPLDHTPKRRWCGDRPQSASITDIVATLTIRKVPTRVMRGLKALAKRRNISIEQEVRELIEDHVTERSSVLQQIEASWALQFRRPSAEEIDSWINVGR